MDDFEIIEVREDSYMEREGTSGEAEREASAYSVDEDFDASDVEILSSDKVLFRADKVALMGASSVFRETIQHDSRRSPSEIEAKTLAGSKPIELEADFEDADTLRLVLRIISASLGRRDLYTWPDMQLYINAIRFADKWDCRLVKLFIELWLEKSLAESDRPDLIYTIFIIAANADNEGLCRKTITTIGTAAGPAATDDKLRFNGGLAMDPTSWPLDHATACPLVYRWCLKRAMDTGGKSGKSRAAEFKRLMGLHKDENGMTP